MEDPTRIQRVKAGKESQLLKMKGVTGVGVGEKISQGAKTGELCIRVYVDKKKPKKQLKASEVIPSTLNGIKTDVIERKFQAHIAVPLEDLKIKEDSRTYETLMGGSSIGPCRAVNGEINVGTLGLIVVDNNSGAPMLLSNFHVMCVDESWNVGDSICQPSRVDGGRCPEDIVATLARAELSSRVDAAVANITNRPHNCTVIDIGQIQGTTEAVLDQAVSKRGRTTEHTHGFVDDLSITANVEYSDGYRLVTNQIGIEYDPSQSSDFGRGGDSGSVVVDGQNKIIGLYFAGTDDGKYGLANPIDTVLNALNVSLCMEPIWRLPDHHWRFAKRVPWQDYPPYFRYPGWGVIDPLPWSEIFNNWMVGSKARQGAGHYAQQSQRGPTERGFSAHYTPTPNFGEPVKPPLWGEYPLAPSLPTSPLIDDPFPWFDPHPKLKGFRKVIKDTIDPVKSPAGYDTAMESIDNPGQFGNWRGLDGPTGLGNIGVAPFAMATPHQAPGAYAQEVATDIEQEIARTEAYLQQLHMQKEANS